MVKFVVFVAGLVQGCGVSGGLSQLAIDSCVWHIHNELVVPDEARIRARADDIDMVMRHIQSLIKVQLIFAWAEKLALLKLKIRKCIGVPLIEKPHRGTLLCIRPWLVEHLPIWEDFTIAWCAKYLGVVLELKARALQWSGPIRTWRSRMGALARSGMGSSAGCRLYLTRALPCLEYEAQVFSLPKQFVKQEYLLLHKAIHLRQTAPPRIVLFNFDLLGGPVNHSISARGC